MTIRQNESRLAWAMLLPWIIGFASFTAGPLLASLYLAFTEYNVFDPPRWVGLENFREATSAPGFWNAWRVTLVYGVAGTVYTLVLALVIALLLYHARRARGFWRTLFYFPALLAGAAEALIMGSVWNPQYGLVNGVLRVFNIEGPFWLTDEKWALPAIILMRYWTIGTAMLLFLGARADVNAQLYEAAKVDGASGWRQFRHISLPMMSSIVLLNLILGMIASFQAFTQVFILTQGGPGDATDLLGIYIYRQTFLNLRLGYGAAVSWTLFALLLALTLLLVATSRRWVYYESGDKY